MNHTTQAILRLQERVNKLEAILTAMGVEIPNERGKKSGGDAAIGNAENLVASRPVPEVWLTAKQVGEQMGMSPSWVKQHSHELPDHCMKRGVRRTRLYLWNDNTKHLFNIQL